MQFLPGPNKCLILAALFLALAAPAPAETIAGIGKDFTLEADSSISGTVILSPDPGDGGATLERLSIDVIEAATFEHLGSRNVSASGEYSVDSLPAGTYILQAQTHDTGYVFEVWVPGADDPFQDPVFDWNLAAPITVDPASPATDRDFELGLGGEISGTVRDQATSLPLAVHVSADEIGGGGNGADTGTDGSYLIRGLPEGIYRVHASAHPQPYLGEYYDDTTDWNQATLIGVPAVPPGGPIPTVEGVDFDLAAAFSISGRVTRADGGDPVANLQITANGLDVSFWEQGWTGAGGNYQISGLAAGNYQVTAETSGTNLVRHQQPADLTAGDVTGVDFALMAGAAIRGRVFEDGDGDGLYDAGEERAAVEIRADDVDSGENVASAVSDADGRYEIRGLGAGGFRVYVETGGHNFVRMYYDRTFSNGDADRVEVSEIGGVPQDVTGIDFALVQGVEIHGSVFYDADGDGFQDAGEPALGGISINGEIQDQQSFDHLWTGTEADGSYVLHGIYPGLYQVSAHAGGTPYASEIYKLVGGLPIGTARRSQADQIDATGGDVSGIDLSLELGGGITGTVRDAVGGDGLSAVNLWVNPFAGDGLWWNVDCDVQGRYLVSGLPAGDYEIRAADRQQSYVGEYHFNALFQEDAAPVTVAARSSATDPLATAVDFDLDRGGAIEGSVYADADGDGVKDAGEPGVSGLQISIEEHAQPHRHLGSSNTDADGSFRVGGLPPGLDLRVHANTWPTEFIGVYYDGVDDHGTTDGEQAAALTVTAGGTTSAIDFGLIAGATISGRVYEDFSGNGAYDPGEEIAGAWIQLYDYDDGGWYFNATTDADGTYRLDGLTAGRYEVRLEPDGRNFVRMYWDQRFDGPTPVEIPAVAGIPQDVAGIDFPAIRGYEIRGVVFADADGDGIRDAGEPGIGNAWINTWSVDDSHSAWANSEPDGSYAIHGVLPDLYHVQAGAQDRISEYWQNVYFRQEASAVDASSGTVAGIDFSLVAGTAIGSLRGRVLAEGTPAGIPDVDVQVWRAVDDDHVASATTDAGGNFVVTGLPPSPAGGYKVWFRTSSTNRIHDSDHVSSFWAASGEPGVIDPDDLRIVFPTLPDPPTGAGTDLGDFVLSSGGSISGTVYPPGGETLPENTRAWVESLVSGGANLPSDRVDAAGAYHIRGLPAPAAYRVWTDVGGGLVVVYYLTAAESTFDQNTATAVAVDIGVDTPGIDLHPFRGGSLSGRVTRAADGSPVPEVQLSAHLQNDLFGRDYWGWGNTDANGEYVIAGLPTGTYRVRVEQRQSDLANQTYPGLVTVDAPDDTPGIDFELAAAGRILGRVTQVVDGVVEPVVNIRIQADDYANDEFVSDGTTDADGYYQIGALAQGTDYRLQVVTWDGQDPQFFNFISELWDDRLRWQDADPVTPPVDPDNVTEVTGIDFELALGGAISGIVEAGGQPLANVWVWAEDTGGLGYGNSDNTDHNGFYVIRGLPADSYRVQADPWPQPFVREYFDDTTDQDQATPVSVLAVPEGGPIPITANVDFDLAAAFSLSGRVTAAEGGAAVPNLYVWAEAPSFYADANTDAAGEYQLFGLPPGGYTVGVATGDTDYISQRQEVDLTADLTGVDFSLIAGARIRGRLFEDLDHDDTYDAGEGRAGIAVQAEDFYDGTYASGGTSGAEGLYELRGLGAGTYRVFADSGEHNFVRTYYDHTFANWQADPLAVTEIGGFPQDVDGLDFRLVRGYEIHGFAFYDENGDGIRQPAEPPLSNFQINAELLQPQPFDHIWGNTETDGTYVLHSVYAGNYLASAHAGGTPYASELYKLVGGIPLGTSRRSEADLIDVTSSDATAIDFSLDLGGGITGTVRDASTGDGIADAGLWVNAFDDDGLWWGATSDPDGSYLVAGLPAGEFRIQAWDPQGVYLSEIHFDAIFQDDATPVQVVARGSTADPLATLVDFDLDRGGTVAGLVYDDVDGDGVRDAGEPGLGDLQVSVEEHDDPWRRFATATTAADGSYEVGGLPPGVDLRLRVDTWPTDFISVYYDGGDDRGTSDGNLAAPVTVPGGGTTASIDFGLAGGGAISGVVVDGDGQPMASSWVNAFALDWAYGNSADTDADGSYTVHALVAGDYRLENDNVWYDDHSDWRAATPVAVTAGQTTTGIDFIRPTVPRIVSGPQPAAGERGTTVTAVTVVAEQLTAMHRLDFGSGITVRNLSLEAATGTFTFDLEIAADAALGMHSLSLINDQLLADGAAVLASAFEVLPAADDEPAPHAERLYAVDNGASQLRVYGASDYALLGTIEVCPNPGAVTMPADGRFAYVSCGRSLSVVDTRLGELGEEVAQLPVFGAFGLQGIDATDRYLYAVDRETGQNQVQVIDLTTWRITAVIPVSGQPWSVRVDPGGTVWVAERNDQALTLFDADVLDPLTTTVSLPAGTWPRGLAFTSDGSRAWVVGNQSTLVFDAALARSDPDNALVATVSTPGAGAGVVEIAHHPASGKELAYLRAGGQIWVLDADPALPAPVVLRTLATGIGIAGLAAGDDRLFLADNTTLDLRAIETGELLSGAARSTVIFDVGEVVDGLPIDGPATPSGGLALRPVPPPPSAAVPTVTSVSGTAVNGAPFTLTVGGSNFGTAPIVGLHGTHARATVVSASADELEVEFAATAPAGEHTLVVSNPLAGGNDSGLGALFEVLPANAFQPTQTLYVSSYGRGRVDVLEPGGGRDAVLTQPYAAGMALTPDGRLGFVVQFYGSPWNVWEDLPENLYDVTVFDTATREIVAVVPYVFSSFASPAITPDPGHPNGVNVYTASRYLADAVSVIDPVTRAEVDLDGDPGTQSIPPDDPYAWIYGQKLPGITRIELDEQVTDLDRSPNDAALTPDGTLLYVANRSGSVSIVDTVTYQVVAELTAEGRLGLLQGLAITPEVTSQGVLVNVAGLDAGGTASLFVFEAGVLDDATAFVDQIVLPVNELPREIGITEDGMAYLSARLLGELWAVDVRPSSWGHSEWGQIERLALFPGVHDVAEATDDRLLYVSNSFRSEVYVLDLSPTNRHQLITTLHFPGSPSAMAVEPILATSKPVVGSLSPASGSPAGGDPVIISGANFDAGATVEFGAGNFATSVEVDNSSVLRAVTPPSPLTGDGTGKVNVKITNPDAKTGNRQDAFTYALDLTPPAFTTPPWVASQALTGAPGSATVTAEIRWRTGEASTSIVDYRRVGDPSFSQEVDTALVTGHLIVLSGLDPATDYELRATSADVHGNAASSPVAPATEVFTTLTAPDLTPPVIVSGPTVAAATDSALIQWQTNEQATSIVHYDAQVGDGHLDRQAFGATGTLHSVDLTGLAPNSEVEYKVLSVDASGNGPAGSAVATFTTLALPDATPPVITAGPEVAYLSNDLVIVLWETDEPATSFVNYGVAAVDESGVIDVTRVNSHVVFLTHLLPGTAYGYQAGSTDAAGNTVVTADPFATGLTAPTVKQLPSPLRLGVVTLPAGTALATDKAAGGFTTSTVADQAAPVVLTATAVALSSDRALVSVETDEAASLKVRYGNGALTEVAFDASFTTASSLLLAGLEAATTYQLSLELADPKGNVTTAELTVITPAVPDVDAPSISGLLVDAVTATTARVSWQTDEPADAGIRFGIGGSFDRQAGRLGLAASHALLLTGLEPAAGYTFEVTSRDANANAGTAPGSFTTAAAAPVITSVTPPRAAQGATVEVVIHGARFGADAALDLGAGVTIDIVDVNATGTRIATTLSVGPGAAVGPRQLTLTTHGLTATVAFAVVDDTIPEVTILEPVAGAELSSRTVLVRGTVSEEATVTVNNQPAVVTLGDPITFAATVTLSEAGQNRIVATAVDASGNRGTAVVVLAVVITDDTPPVLTATADPSVLWPPNHKLVEVSVDLQVSDDQDPGPEVVLLSVTSNEPDDGSGDGDTGGDIQGVELGSLDLQVLLRAERDGGGTGRIYTLIYQATDDAGNVSEAAVEVLVPLSRGN